MSQELKPMETFMERVKGKLRDDIGGLLPDEAVAEMVQKVINDEFFTKKKVNVGSEYHPKWEERPTKFQEMVLEAAKPIIEKHVARILIERAPDIEAQIKAAIEAGLGSLVVNNIDKVLGEALQKMQWNIENNITQHFRNRGIPV